MIHVVFWIMTVLSNVWVVMLTGTCCVHVRAMVTACFCQHGYLSMGHMFSSCSISQ